MVKKIKNNRLMNLNWNFKMYSCFCIERLIIKCKKLIGKKFREKKWI